MYTLGNLLAFKYFLHLLLYQSIFLSVELKSVAMAKDLKKIKEVHAVADANSLFSASLHLALKNDNPDNLIFSPFSIGTVAAMAKLGARGKTADEIAKGFHFPSSDEVLGKGYSQVLAALKESNEDYTLATANKLYCKVGFEVKTEYLQAVKKSFHAEVEQIDFMKGEAAAKTINTWVEVVTKNKIKDLFTSDSLNDQTAIVLVNGIYFKGLWKEKFDPKHTRKAQFHLNNKDSVEVDMMYKQEKFPYTNLKKMDAHAVVLPYRGDRLSMIIYLPKKNGGLSKVENGLKNFKPSKILGMMRSNDLIDVSLPRFKIESTLRLVEPLKKLGIQTMFTNASDFGGIPKSRVKLRVSDVVQKTFIEVNEEGSEAAAATGMTISVMSMPQVIPFVVDHPFAYQIVDRDTNFILFAGSYGNPKKT